MEDETTEKIETEDQSASRKIGLVPGQEVVWMFANEPDGSMWVVPILNTFFDTGVMGARSIAGPNGKPARMVLKTAPVVLNKLAMKFTRDELLGRMDMGVPQQLMAIGVKFAKAEDVPAVRETP